jgi:hypothetical protein
VPIAGGAVFADLDDAHAHLVVDDLVVEDYHDVVNAILDGPSLQAEVSFKARWHGVHHRRHVHNAQQRFDLHAVQTWATVEWTGRSRPHPVVSSPSVFPLTTSPLDAIPVGTHLCPSSGTADQRGVRRPQGGACDIGAASNPRFASALPRCRGRVRWTWGCANMCS